MNSWKKQLSNLEIIALCSYVLNPKNECVVVDSYFDYSFLDEGLEQTLYFEPKYNEYVFVVRQKGYIMNALLIQEPELDDFMEQWKSGKIFPYGRVEQKTARK